MLVKLQVIQLQTRIDVYKYSFLPRTIIQWNQLPIPDINKINMILLISGIGNMINMILLILLITWLTRLQLKS